MLKVGCDPEVFLFHPGEGFISAHGLLPGTKKNPFKVDKGAVQVDGLAFEFNIDPAETAEEFDNNISTVLTQMKEMVHKISPEIKLTFTAFANFDVSYFNNLPDESKILGCDPDFTIEGELNTPDPELQYRPFRTAAGHIHIGFVEDEEIDPYSRSHIEDCKFISQLFYRKNFFSPVREDELKRIKYYGSPGSFRPKKYGIELRSPSNRWVERKDFRIKMFNIVKNTMPN